MIIEEMNAPSGSGNGNGAMHPTAIDATQISVLIPTSDETRGPGLGLGLGQGLSTPRDVIPPATNYSEKSLQPQPYESPFPPSRRTSRRLNDQPVFPEFPVMPGGSSEIDTPTSSTQIRFLDDDEDPAVLLENNPMKNANSSTIASHPLNAINRLPSSAAATNPTLGGASNNDVWPWFIPSRFVFIRKRPDFYFPERVYQLTLLQRIFVFFEHPKSSRWGTVYFLLLICVIVLGVASLVLATENMFQYTPTTCSAPACNNDPNLCPGTISTYLR